VSLSSGAKREFGFISLTCWEDVSGAHSKGQVGHRSDEKKDQELRKVPISAMDGMDIMDVRIGEWL
jgi:hypothetical protein